MYKVAICDDDKNYISELTEIILECNAKKNEIQILKFHSGEQLLKEELDDYDIIFLDIQMAGMNGNETAVHLKERGYHGILVQCSGIFMPTPDTVKIAPFRYLLKQDSREKTLREMEEILTQMVKKRQCYEMDAYYLRKKIVIHVSDIVYITHHPKRKSVLHLCHERAGEFVKGDRADLRTAGAERDAKHFEVALHLTALARGTVLDDVGVVEAHLAAEHANGKFVLVNFGT